MLLIGIAGKKYSGKDTVANYIATCFKAYRSERIAFADALKEEVAKACESTVEFMEANKDTFRPMYQWWGTDFRRKLYSTDYWIAQWMRKCKFSNADIILAPDVRFINEAQMIHKIGGYVIRVNRNTSYNDVHASETELDNYPKFDFVISNNGTLKELKTQVKTCISQLVQQHSIK